MRALSEQQTIAKIRIFLEENYHIQTSDLIHVLYFSWIICYFKNG